MSHTQFSRAQQFPCVVSWKLEVGSWELEVESNLSGTGYKLVPLIILQIGL